ncbi:site-specific tyrosine recombinase/integron integrase [Bacillus tequilensis]|uniref:site-specific tyrosine recombinase/integron integrase n=1 Tax=Bacillus tequilensis TaxID=227866 RepID=UPI0004634370|nr:site-specific tyrosine recombinase/integron integrase [Bacillus tequilensis]MDR4436146.1 tyrosine-type recombinase/integrase [Bacillus tequilensis]SPT93250.1 site-specific tyrosine recombinase [Bacillus tequilensis]
MNYANRFETHMRVEKDLSDNTISNYMRDLGKFTDYIDVDLIDVTPDHVRTFISHLSKNGLKRNSINRALYSLKSFYKYLKEVEGVIQATPTDGIKVGSREKSLPKFLSKEDVLRLLETASREGVRSRLYVELLYGLGGRVAEVAALRVEDIDFEGNYIRLRGKGNKERHNPIHESCIQLIRQYIKDLGITSGFLFPHRFDKSRHVTREAIFLNIKNIADKAGIDRNLVSPHVFRHSFATHLLDNGCDMAIVQEFLGHEDISTTKIYAKVTRGNKSNNYKKFHPLA